MFGGPSFVASYYAMQLHNCNLTVLKDSKKRNVILKGPSFIQDNLSVNCYSSLWAIFWEKALFFSFSLKQPQLSCTSCFESHLKAFQYNFNELFYFLAPASNIVTSSDQTITAPAELTLNCSADGKPKPTITWTRVSDNTNVSKPLNVTRGKNEESYRCTAYNGVGNPLTKVVKITIHCE